MAEWPRCPFPFFHHGVLAARIDSQYPLHPEQKKQSPTRVPLPTRTDKFGRLFRSKKVKKMATELESQQQQEIEKLKGEVAEFKLREEESERTRSLAAAATSAKQAPGRIPNSAVELQQRQQAIKAVGGNSFWGSLSLDERLRALGQRPASGEEITLAKKLFGRDADSREANRVARYNPSQYSRLRMIFREL